MALGAVTPLTIAQTVRLGLRLFEMPADASCVSIGDAALVGSAAQYFRAMANVKRNDGFVTVYSGGSYTKEFPTADDPLQIFKIIVIGDSNVGKTCLAYRFCGGRFLKNPEATIGVDFRERTVAIDGESVKLQIWDTAGQERFRKSMVEHYYRNVHAVIFVYDTTKLSTLENMPEWIEECTRHCVSPTIPQILVGNKCDLQDRREVPTSLAQRMADEYNFPLFETSAKDPTEKEHVDAIFLTLAYRLKNHKPLRLKQPSEVTAVHLTSEQEYLPDHCAC